MTVRDCMVEIRKIEDAIDTLNKYERGVMPCIAKQHIDAMREVLEHYMDAISEKEIVP